MMSVERSADRPRAAMLRLLVGRRWICGGDVPVERHRPSIKLTSRGCSPWPTRVPGNFSKMRRSPVLLAQSNETAISSASPKATQIVNEMASRTKNMSAANIRTDSPKRVVTRPARCRFLSLRLSIDIPCLQYFPATVCRSVRCQPHGARDCSQTLVTSDAKLERPTHAT